MQKSTETQKSIPVCNVDKPTTEEWMRGRHWHQADTTEINRHKRSSQKRKKKSNTTHRARLSLDWIHQPQAKNSKANRFKKGNGRGARRTGGPDDASSVSSKLLAIFIYIYKNPLSRACFFDRDLCKWPLPKKQINKETFGPVFTAHGQIAWWRCH